jgi:hypothetical protein
LGDELAGAGAVEALVMVHALEPALVMTRPSESSTAGVGGGG